jgi:bacteriorhodopsin
MSLASTVKFTNAVLMGLFSIFLIAKGESAPLIAIPAISATKYTYIYGSPDEERQKAHYLSWFLTTPIMLWLIFSLNKLPFSTIAVLLALNQLMIVSGYVASVAKDEETVWRWFWVGCLAFLPIVYQLLQFSEGFALVLLTLITWSAYPVVWYLSKKNLMDDDTRDISYSVLDFTSKVGIVLLYLVEVGRLKLPRLV